MSFCTNYTPLTFVPIMIIFNLVLSSAFLIRHRTPRNLFPLCRSNPIQIQSSCNSNTMLIYAFLSLLIFQLSFVRGSIDSNCYEKARDLNTILDNWTYCGSKDTVMNNFHAMDTNNDGVVDSDEYKVGCFLPFTELLYCYLDINSKIICLILNC